MADQNNNPQSFKPYTGKAPVFVQIVGGLLWLGAAGTIIIGLLSLITNLIVGIAFLVTAAFMIITARSLFKMKKEAFRNSLVLTGIFIVIFIYAMVTSNGSASYSNLVSPLAILAVAFIYRKQFIN